MTKKVLYLMHVNWGWAKQRPHFLAEYLAENFDITVCYLYSYKKNTVKAEKGVLNMQFSELMIFPFARFGLINYLNTYLVSFQLSKFMKWADVIWITHPKMFSYIEKKLNNSKTIIYDCMDDALEFPHVVANENFKKVTHDSEQALVERANIIFASSNYLANKLSSRYKSISNIKVINNGISDISYKSEKNNQELIEISKILKSISGIKLIYIGTISSWMDFELIEKSLKIFPEITYVFIGPCEVSTPKNNRMIFIPPVKHGLVSHIMKMADILIMPFKVNELIKSVDPVKVYEYIASGKPAIVVGYDETNKFKKYIHTYRTEMDYMSQLSEIISSDYINVQSKTDIINFLNDNTWKKRAQQIMPFITPFT